MTGFYMECNTGMKWVKWVPETATGCVFWKKSLRACNFLKKRLQHWCFPVKFAKILATPILKNICERLLLGFVKLSTHKFSCLVLQQYFLDICFYRLEEFFENVWMLKQMSYFSIWNKVDVSYVFSYKIINIKSKFRR